MGVVECECVLITGRIRLIAELEPCRAVKVCVESWGDIGSAEGFLLELVARRSLWSPLTPNSESETRAKH